ncbi:hypothetical protein E1262_02685 [Jiangella aurantiaca]|uniref:Zinc-finger domain-containing protein n=1 Tax=Jiangella aurantiaca TaxID=2530373 RepID=A0A4R5AKA6_9ACTN|nr:hypothetical protein [Jiangella aurantiaca]TDD72245.1 hypothetical protein E1262_02685 [Jiangella aurantiaca]
MTTAGAHPPTHVLAGLAEGVLDDAQAREVQAHVDQCLTCRATLDELAQVTVALRALPPELPVPEFVAARISHALAAERAGSSSVGNGAEGPAAGAEGGTVAWFRRRLPQGLAAAASVAVLGLAGYVAVEGGGDDSGSDTAADEAAAGAQAQTEDAAPGLGPSLEGSRLGAPDTTLQDTTSESPTGPGEEAYTSTDGADVDAAELTASAQNVIRQRTAVNDTCGEKLAEQQGLPLVGSAYDFAGVVVVLDADTTYQGWLIDTCNSVDAGEIVPHVDVPKAE